MQGIHASACSWPCLPLQAPQQLRAWLKSSERELRLDFLLAWSRSSLLNRRAPCEASGGGRSRLAAVVGLDERDDLEAHGTKAAGAHLDRAKLTVEIRCRKVGPMSKGASLFGGYYHLSGKVGGANNIVSKGRPGPL